MIKVAALFFSFALIVGCASDSTKEPPKSKLNYLNGEHYGTNVNLQQPGIPILPEGIKRESKNSTISGSVVAKDGLIFAPLNHQTLALFDSKGKRMAKIMSGAGGAFQFQGAFPNGTYTIQILSKKYKGQIAIDLASYEMKDLKLVVKPQSSN